MNTTSKEEIHKKVEHLTRRAEYLKQRYYETSNEIESYYYKISLCNSSDSFRHWKVNNPNHEHLDKFTVKRPIFDGILSDVILRILKCDISREDFISLAKEVVSPLVGNDDFDLFNRTYPV